jgi:hypothetical protein
MALALFMLIPFRLLMAVIRSWIGGDPRVAPNV